MSLFLALMVIGLTGLVMMAIPFFGRHGHAASHGPVPIGHGHGVGHIAHAADSHAAVHAATQGAGAQGKEISGGNTPAGLTRFIPSPRVLFSLLALYGAFGNALVELWHLPAWMAGLVALLPSLVLERFMVTPLWEFLIRFQARPSSPIEQLIMDSATAVTPFRNGRGLVSVVRDGRSVQFRAELAKEQAAMPVGVGDQLRIENVDAAKERLTVRLQ